MTQHLQYFLLKIAALAKVPITGKLKGQKTEPFKLQSEGTHAVVPTFPGSSGVNQGSSSAPPPPPGTFDSPVQPGGGKKASIRSVEDFTKMVREPLKATRASHQDTPTEKEYVHWSDPASAEGGDAMARLEGHIGSPTMKFSFLEGSLAKRGLGAAGKAIGAGSRNATVTDVASTAAFAPMTYSAPTARLSKDDVAAKGNPYKPTGLSMASAKRRRGPLGRRR